MRTGAELVVARKPMSQRLQVFFELAKLRLSSLVLVTVAVGWLAARLHGQRWTTAETPLLTTLIAAMFGVLATAAGAAAINQVIERELDARMHRTRERPLPSRRISVDGALTFGLVAILVGLLVLILGSGPLAALLAFVSAIVYVVVYTPLKRMTTLNTIVGAVSGALPPMIGYVAATGTLDAHAWALFGILFVWQIPHFLAIAWLYREDYARAGMRMLGVVDADGSLTMRQLLLFGLLLIPVSLMPVATGLSGVFYAIVALVLGLWFALGGVRLMRSKTREDARRLFFISLLYLPLLLVALLGDILLFGGSGGN
ncbi:MAG: protoheme IX farnesyltransferase [Planctomycetes bacterium]|nr:protoheme IX farnesyltransferase [Planctomycetota bacterium]MCB9916766.1 protoheme IX farnesyltransferase [Planctomycetota bacterium]